MGRWILTPEGALNLDQLARLTVEGGHGWWIVVGWTGTGERVVARESFTSDAEAVAWIRDRVAPPITGGAGGAGGGHARG